MILIGVLRSASRLPQGGFSIVETTRPFEEGVDIGASDYDPIIDAFGSSREILFCVGLILLVSCGWAYVIATQGGAVTYLRVTAGRRFSSALIALMLTTAFLCLSSASSLTSPTRSLWPNGKKATKGGPAIG